MPERQTMSRTKNALNLTAGQIKAIRLLRCKGWKLAPIASFLGFSVATVYRHSIMIPHRCRWNRAVVVAMHRRSGKLLVA